MSPNITQLAALLELWPQPARILAPDGAPAAQNGAARIISWAPRPSLQTRNLGDGWQLQIQAAPPAAPRSLRPPVEIEALARGIAHEIRNPLSSILTAINLVQDDPGLADETIMLLCVVKKESLRMNRILTEFSSYVRPPVPAPTVFNLAAAVRDTAQELRRAGELAESIDCCDDLPEDLPVRADEMQIRLVLRQIVQNAADAMPAGGTLSYALHTARPAWEEDVVNANGSGARALVTIDIEDSGPGFSAEGLQRAFQPFYSKKSQSTGLGLSIAQAAVQAAGGRIRLENRMPPPTGARVCLALPGGAN